MNKNIQVYAYVTPEEKQYLDQHVERLGYPSVSTFLIAVMKAGIPYVRKYESQSRIQSE